MINIEKTKEDIKKFKDNSEQLMESDLLEVSEWLNTIREKYKVPETNQLPYDLYMLTILFERIFRILKNDKDILYLYIDALVQELENINKKEEENQS